MQYSFACSALLQTIGLAYIWPYVQAYKLDLFCAVQLSLLHPGRGAYYCDQSVCVRDVCMCVCLQAYLRIRWPDLHQFYACPPWPWLGLSLWRRCDTLCISGVVDDVTFGCNGPYGVFQHRGRVWCLWMTCWLMTEFSSFYRIKLHSTWILNPTIAITLHCTKSCELK